jgi:hypothetical protein
MSKVTLALLVCQILAIWGLAGGGVLVRVPIDFIGDDDDLL